jgi:hypothetical protein
MNWAKSIDEWKDQQPHYGTSGRAMSKIFLRLGLMKNYWFIKNVEDMFRWVLSRGPVAVGVTWFDQMFRPETHGTGFHWTTIGGRPSGGHEVLVTGADRDGVCPDGSEGYFEYPNSWGEAWGTGGFARISAKQMQFLLDLDGDAIVPTETLVTPQVIVPEVKPQVIDTTTVVAQDSYEFDAKFELSPGGNVYLFPDNAASSHLATSAAKKKFNNQRVKVRITK